MNLSSSKLIINYNGYITTSTMFTSIVHQLCSSAYISSNFSFNQTQIFPTPYSKLLFLSKLKILKQNTQKEIKMKMNRKEQNP